MCQQLIHLFADLGANGLLIEYEDMFPYEGELKVLQASAYPSYRWLQSQSLISPQNVIDGRQPLDIVDAES